MRLYHSDQPDFAAHEFTQTRLSGPAGRQRVTNGLAGGVEDPVVSLAVSREGLELPDDRKPAQVFDFRQLRDTGLLYPLLGLRQLFACELDLFTNRQGQLETLYPPNHILRIASGFARLFVAGNFNKRLFYLGIILLVYRLGLLGLDLLVQGVIFLELRLCRSLRWRRRHRGAGGVTSTASLGSTGLGTVGVPWPAGGGTGVTGLRGTGFVKLVLTQR